MVMFILQLQLQLYCTPSFLLDLASNFGVSYLPIFNAVELDTTFALPLCIEI